MPVYKDERRTAGAILAEILLSEEAGEDVATLEQEFQEKSAAQLGIPVSDFIMKSGCDAI
jgi:hypothetical protein